MTEVSNEIYIENPSFLKVPANKKTVVRSSDLSTWLRYNATSANAL
jgi:hypothetical protein